LDDAIHRDAVQEAKNVLRVPQSALVRKDGRNQCFVVFDERKAEFRYVTTGISDGKYVEIKSGLKEGEVVRMSK
jgi:macrolide-specific efflux system membrane fusion protein